MILNQVSNSDARLATFALLFARILKIADVIKSKYGYSPEAFSHANAEQQLFYMVCPAISTWMSG